MFIANAKMASMIDPRRPDAATVARLTNRVQLPSLALPILRILLMRLIRTMSGYTG